MSRRAVELFSGVDSWLCIIYPGGIAWRTGMDMFILSPLSHDNLFFYPIVSVPQLCRRIHEVVQPSKHALPKRRPAALERTP